MPTTTLWIDPATRRVAHFAQAAQAAPSRITVISAQGSSIHELADLSCVSYADPLPVEMLPQVCWLYRLEGGRLELATDLA